MTERCGAKNKDGTSCKAWPLRGGTRCRMHNGKRVGRPIKHGRYSIKAKGDLAERIAHFEHDEAFADQRGEIALLRALNEDFLNRSLDLKSALNKEEIQLVADLVDRISRIAKRMTDSENARALTVSQLQYERARIADIIKRYVPSERWAECALEIEGADQLQGQSRALAQGGSAPPGRHAA